jgi:hypothetical protein
MTRGLSYAAIVLTLLASGCTAGTTYEMARGAQRVHCNKLPETEKNACLDRIQDDYGTYQRKRAEAKSEPQN